MMRNGLLQALILTAMVVLQTPQVDANEAPKYLAVCSTTQVADFTRQITGDRWRVHCVLGAKQDPHTYQTKPSDLRLVEQANLCLQNGWHLEGGNWMQNLAETAKKPLVSCVKGVSPLVLDYDGAKVDDPHAWFSPKNAATYVRNILAGVSQVDPDHKREYQIRAELYLRQLQTLHAWIQKQLNTVPTDQRILVTSHDAFGYFCQAYGFRSAAPAGWSTGVEVGGDITPARRQKTIESIREYGVRSIFVETSVNQKLIRQIAREAGVQIGGELYSDAMGAAGSAGETYIGMMRENVVTIVMGLQ